MKVVALTGTIGSGKSAAVDVFSELSVPTIDADKLSREVVEPGTVGLQEVTTEFGADILQGDGGLDRKKLGSIIFSDAEKRKKLEQILHPKIRELFLERVQETAQNHPEKPFLIYEIPLFFETNYPRDHIAAVVVVYTPHDICVQRIMQRDGCTEEQAKEKLSSQIGIDEKVSKADYVIRNDRDLDSLRAEVQRVNSELLSSFAS